MDGESQIRVGCAAAQLFPQAKMDWCYKNVYIAFVLLFLILLAAVIGLAVMRNRSTCRRSRKSACPVTSGSDSDAEPCEPEPCAESCVESDDDTCVISTPCPKRKKCRTNYAPIVWATVIVIAIGAFIVFYVLPKRREIVMSFQHSPLSRFPTKKEGCQIPAVVSSTVFSRTSTMPVEPPKAVFGQNMERVLL